MNTPKIENDDAASSHPILSSCRICGVTVVDVHSKGLPSYCRRHTYVMARILELVGNERRTPEGTQRLFKQAEDEASRLYGDLERY